LCEFVRHHHLQEFAFSCCEVLMSHPEDPAAVSRDRKPAKDRERATDLAVKPPPRPDDPVVVARAKGKFVPVPPDQSATIDVDKPWWARGPPVSGLALECVLSLPEVAELRGVSVDTIRRRYAHLVRRLSPRRVGMRLADALTIGSATN
jgi:hypothetical protein